MNFKLPVTTWPAAGYINLESLQSHDSEVLALMSRSETIFLLISNGLVILTINHRGSEFW